MESLFATTSTFFVSLHASFLHASILFHSLVDGLGATRSLVASDVVEVAAHNVLLFFFVLGFFLLVETLNLLHLAAFSHLLLLCDHSGFVLDLVHRLCKALLLSMLRLLDLL
jgi:hypothetical protein